MRRLGSFILGLAKAHVGVPQNFVDALIEPTCVAEFENIFAGLGQQADEISQAFVIALKAGSELEQDRSQAANGAQWFQRF